MINESKLKNIRAVFIFFAVLARLFCKYIQNRIVIYSEMKQELLNYIKKEKKKTNKNKHLLSSFIESISRLKEIERQKENEK